MRQASQLSIRARQLRYGPNFIWGEFHLSNRKLMMEHVKLAIPRRAPLEPLCKTIRSAFSLPTTSLAFD